MYMMKEWPTHLEVLDNMCNEEKISILKEILVDVENKELISEFNTFRENMLNDSDFTEDEKNNLSLEYKDELTIDYILDAGMLDSLIEDSEELQEYIECNYECNEVIDYDRAYDEWRDDQLG